MADVFTLQSYQINDWWPHIEPFLSRVERPDWTPEGVRAELEQSMAQFWGMADDSRLLAVWITKVQETSRGKRGLLWIAAGSELHDGLALFRLHTEPWLKAQGCRSIQILGRKGWQRVLPDYDDVGIVLEKVLQ